MTTVDDARRLCRLLELILPQFGFHVALTGGFLYRDYSQGRKDIDIILYRIRYKEWDAIKWRELLDALDAAGLKHLPTDIVPAIEIDELPRWLLKFKWEGHTVDVMMPEADDEDYLEEI